MDHTSATPTRAKRPKPAKVSREKISVSGPRDPPQAAPPRATAAALLDDDDDDAMDTAGGAAPAATVPSGTDAASLREGIINSSSKNFEDFDQDTTVAANLNKCKFVEEVVGPPISQQVSTLIVQPNKFRNKGKTSAGAGGIPADAADADEYWRCPPHTPVFTNVAEGARPEDGVPRVISHVPDGLDPTGWFRFVGVTMEDGIMDVAAQKTHKRCNGKGRFTVAAKGTVTVNCSVDNLREAQFAYGDPFCISLYRGSLPNGVETSAPDAGSIRSCAFGGRLESTKQRTFVYNKVGIRIGTFIKPLVGPTGGVRA